MNPPFLDKPWKPDAPLWFMLGVRRVDETIVVLGFKIGPAAGARAVMLQRAKDERVEDYEMFNLFDPAERLRDAIASWLIAAGLSVEDAKESSITVLKSVAAEFKQVKRRRGKSKR